MKCYPKILMGIIIFITFFNKVVFCLEISYRETTSTINLYMPHNSLKLPFSNMYNLSFRSVSLYHPKHKVLAGEGEVLSTKTDNSATGSKVVFLTFDDGPSYNNTTKILNILKSNNVKATFFVIGKSAESNKKLIKDMENSGMCILPHTYSHDYKTIYKNEDEYFKDLSQCISVIKDNTYNKSIKFIRLPGGADNKMGSSKILNVIKQKLLLKEINYIDWNVSSMDAGNYHIAAKDIKRTVIDQCKNWDIPVILMHDSESKRSTVEALQDIIIELKKQGYTFKTLDDISEEEMSRLKKYKILNK